MRIPISSVRRANEQGVVPYRPAQAMTSASQATADPLVSLLLKTIEET
jgi:hypothetical protein